MIQLIQIKDNTQLVCGKYYHLFIKSVLFIYTENLNLILFINSYCYCYSVTLKILQEKTLLLGLFVYKLTQNKID